MSAEPMTIDRSRVIEVRLHHYVTEASDIGLPPGVPWPRQVVIPGAGNGQPFTYTSGTLEKAYYKQVMGCLTMTIFND